MDFTSKYTLSKSLMTQNIEDEVLLMDMQTQLFYELSGSAALMWEVMQDHESIDAVYEEMRELFDVDAAQLKKDIETFISNLVENKMLVLDV